jgi:hypothetical protein
VNDFGVALSLLVLEAGDVMEVQASGERVILYVHHSGERGRNPDRVPHAVGGADE